MYIIAIAAFLFSYYFVNVVHFAEVFKRVFEFPPGKRLKPFDCVVCLSVWVAVILYFLPLEVSQFLAIAFGAGFLAIKIK